MYKLSQSLEGINKVCTNSRTAFFLTKNNRIYKDETLLFEGQDYSDIRICKNDFYSFGDSTISYLGDFRNNTISEIDFVFSSECIWRNGAMINENYRYDVFDGKVKADYLIFDFDTKQKRILFKDLEGRITCLFDGNKKAIYLFKTILRSLSLITGSYEWEVDLGEKLGNYDGISKIYGLVNECLWLVTQRGVILGININNGKLIHYLNFDGYDTFQQYGTVQMQYFRSLFDEKQQILIGVYENRYWEIDLKADKLALHITDIKALNPSYFNNPSFIYEVYHLAAPEGIAYDEQYIYFKDNEVSTVGVLNRQTKQIEWHDKLYELPGRSYVMIRDIQVAANKMYVLDEKGVLHIFEKEQV